MCTCERIGNVNKIKWKFKACADCAIIARWSTDTWGTRYVCGRNSKVHAVVVQTVRSAFSETSGAMTLS